jgi:RND superfamily putative drug exporter
LNKRFESDLSRAEFTSLPLTIILIVAFGALVAAGLPVLLAFSAVLAATGLNSIISHLVPTDVQTVTSVILMIGMAVGIDYSLFYIQREREERGSGRRHMRHSCVRLPRRGRRCSSRAPPSSSPWPACSSPATRSSRRSPSGR